MFSSNLKRLLFVIFIAAITPFSVNAKLSGSLTEDAIKERLAPTGKVHVSGEVAKAVLQTETKALGPKKIYEDNCKMCHAPGLAGAPKFRNKKDWNDRISQGIDTMTKKAVQGFKAMPPKGNCLSCSDDDIKQTIEFMIKGL